MIFTDSTRLTSQGLVIPQSKPPKGSPKNLRSYPMMDSPHGLLLVPMN